MLLKGFAKLRFISMQNENMKKESSKYCARLSMLHNFSKFAPPNLTL